MTLELATPLGLLVALLGALPVAAAALRERRLADVRAALRLRPPPRRAQARLAIGSALVFGCLGAAAAQPLLVLREAVPARADAEAFVLLDSSRSMLASAAPGAPTRFERARELALRLRAGLPTVPVGVASITDRPLPHLFPTVDPAPFAGVVGRAVGVDRPPPAEPGEVRATDLGSLAAFGRDNYFSATSARRVVLVLTDGETRPFDAVALAGRLRRDGVAVVIVRVGDLSELVFTAEGEPEAGYVSDRSAGPQLARLAAAMPGGRVFAEHEAGAALEAARAALGEGPTVAVVERERRLPLGGWLALAAAAPLGALLARGLPGRLAARRAASREVRRAVFAYCMLAAWRGSWKSAASRSRRAPAPSRQS